MKIIRERQLSKCCRGGEEGKTEVGKEAELEPEHCLLYYALSRALGKEGIDGHSKSTYKSLLIGEGQNKAVRGFCDTFNHFAARSNNLATFSLNVLV